MTKDTGLIRHSNTSSTTAVLWSAIFITRTTWSCWSVTTLTCHEHFCPWFSDLAGSTQCFEPKPHRQLPSVPQSCCSGCPSFTGQQAQQPVLCPVSVPSGPIMPAWRKQPLHRGQCPWLHFNLIREYISEKQWNENKKTRVFDLQWWRLHIWRSHQGFVTHWLTWLFLPQMVCERPDVFASSCAIARAFSIFSRRSTSSRRSEKKHVTIEFVIIGQESSPLDEAELKVWRSDFSLKHFTSFSY